MKAQKKDQKCSQLRSQKLRLRLVNLAVMSQNALLVFWSVNQGRTLVEGDYYYFYGLTGFLFIMYVMCSPVKSFDCLFVCLFVGRNLLHSHIRQVLVCALPQRIFLRGHCGRLRLHLCHRGCPIHGEKL